MKVLKQVRNGQPVELTTQIANSGEGTVWRTSLEGVLAKLYHEPTPERLQKLQVMINHPPKDPMFRNHHITFAWPQEMVQDSKGQGLGFLMPEIVNSVKLSSIYNPKLRNQKAPRFNWHYLHTAALNFALALQSLHREGYVVGDIKPQNLLVNNQALISIIDTDSFQVRGPKTKTIYRCLVGSEGFTPPELLGKDLAQVDQTDVHDRFRLAVIIYLLLFGDYPFKGRWVGPGESPQPTELTQKGYWPFGPNSLIQAGPNTIPLEIVHPQIQACLRRCFDVGHHHPQARPTATQWVQALQLARSNLAVCQTENNHTYSRHQGQCYWCQRKALLHLDIFDPRPRLKVRSTVNVSHSSALPSPLRTSSLRPPRAGRYPHRRHSSLNPLGHRSHYQGQPLPVSLIRHHTAKRLLPHLPKRVLGGVLCVSALLGLVILIEPEALFTFSNDLDRNLETQVNKTVRWLTTIWGGYQDPPYADDQLSPLNTSAASASAASAGHDDAITTLLVSPDNRYVLSGSRDFKIKVWDIATGQLRHTLSEHYDPVVDMQYVEQGATLISHDARGKVVLWNVETGESLSKENLLSELTTSVSSPAVRSQRAFVLVSNTRAGAIQVHDLRTNQVQEIGTGLTWHQAIGISPDARTLVSSSDGQIKLWDVQTGTVKRYFPRLQDFQAVERMRATKTWVMSSDGRQVASGGWDGGIHLWNLETGQWVGSLPGHEQSIETLVFSQDAQLLVSGGSDRTIKVWDVAQGKLLHTLSGHQDQISALSVSANQEWLVSGSKDQTVKIWRLDTGTLEHTLGVAR